jgi:hypothetical protein
MYLERAKWAAVAAAVVLAFSAFSGEMPARRPLMSTSSSAAPRRSASILTRAVWGTPTFALSAPPISTWTAPAQAEAARTSLCVLCHFFSTHLRH